MNTQTFTHLLQNPNTIVDEHVFDFEEIISTYPYFQSAYALYLKALNNQQSYKYNQMLKNTAAITADRTVLFEFITSKQISVQETVRKKEVPIKVEQLSIKKLFSKKKIENKESEKEELTQQLEIGRPINFDINEHYSFNQWLQLSKLKHIDRSEPLKSREQDTNEQIAVNNEGVSVAQRNKKTLLIDRFISNYQKSERIVPSEASVKSAENPVISLAIDENEDLMTETLARVYLEQKKYDDAVKAYRILSLKYPEKSGFFADQIKKIKLYQDIEQE